MTGFRNDDDILSKYNYPYVVRDKLLEIEIMDLKKARHREIIDDLRGQSGKVGRNKSFIMKHFGRHVKENKEKSSRAGANFSKANVNGSNFDKKIKESKNKGSGFPGGVRPEELAAQSRHKMGAPRGGGSTGSPPKKMSGKGGNKNKLEKKIHEYGHDR